MEVSSNNQTVLMAVTVIGYIALAAVFYSIAVRSALKIEDNKASVPARVGLTVVEGGLSVPEDVRKVA